VPVLQCVQVYGCGTGYTLCQFNSVFPWMAVGTRCASFTVCSNGWLKVHVVPVLQCVQAYGSGDGTGG
jgi:hypothetical protein